MADDLSEPQMFPMARAARCPFDPAPQLGRLIEEARHPYEDACAVLADPRVSVDVAEPGFPHTNAVSKAHDAQMKTLMQMDAPEHTTQRRLMTAADRR